MQHRSPGRMCLTDLWRPEAWRSARVLRGLPKAEARRWRPPPGAAQRAPSCRSTAQFGSTGGLFMVASSWWPLRPEAKSRWGLPALRHA